MDPRRRARVTLRGAVSGDYVVVEERPDGSLVLAPDTVNRTGSTERRMTTEEILEEWGVQLRGDELPGELFVADVDDTPGFVAITSQRFIFVADTGRGLSVVQEHLLSAARNVQSIRRGMRHKLRVTWHGDESLIVTPDRKSLARLQHYLEDRAIA
jgi:hypothetical protein